MKPTTTPYKFLAPDPSSSYLQLAIKGTRILARTVYGQHVNTEEPRTAEQLASDFGLPLEAVLEAIAYCQSSPQDIADDHSVEETLAAATGMNDPEYRLHPTPKLLSPQEIVQHNRQPPAPQPRRASSRPPSRNHDRSA
ncbi:MAG: hypothetical protein HY721_18480 [Planctomycetes bacterium]|nr:hypothetical protein [Planctomycetota bacterium]